ncbi:hypothetical protein ES708_34047 [subsurface metagenome]
MDVSKSALISLKCATDSCFSFDSISVVNNSMFGIPSAQDEPAPKKNPIFFE